MANVSSFPIVGKPDCPTLKVPPFGRLYIQDEQPPPEPIDGPVPASPYIIPLPAPNPCVCLSFTIPPDVAPDSRLRLVPPEASPKGLSLAIKPVDGDNCCDGRFNIMPDLELPCVPFTLKSGDMRLNIRNTPDSSAAAFRRFGLRQKDCALTPEIELDLPCVPTPTYAYQISGYDNGTYTTKEVQHPEITGTACDPTVTAKLDMPCPISVDAQELAFRTGTPGTVKLHLEREADGCGVRLVSTVDQQPGQGQECPISVSDNPITVNLVKTEPANVPNSQSFGLKMTKTADCGIGLQLVGQSTLYVPGSSKQVTDVTGKLEDGVFYICVKYKDGTGIETEECHEAFRTLKHSRCMD